LTVGTVATRARRKHGRGVCGPVREKKKGEMGRPNGIVEFLIYSKKFKRN
jgi:hypothetical protein